MTKKAEPIMATEDGKQTFSTSEAVRRLRISRATFDKRVRERGIKPIYVDQLPRYSSEALAELEAPLEEGEHDPTKIAQAQLIESMTGLVKQAEDHAAKLLALLVVPIEKFMGEQTSYSAELHSALGRERKKYAELLEASEKMITKHHEREIEMMREAAQERRKDEMLGMVRASAPTLISGIAGWGSGKVLQSMGPLFNQFLEHVDQETLFKMAQQIPSTEGKLAMMRIIQVLKKELGKNAEKKPAASTAAPTDGAPAVDPKLDEEAKAAEEAMKS